MKMIFPIGKISIVQPQIEINKWHESCVCVFFCVFIWTCQTLSCNNVCPSQGQQKEEESLPSGRTI